MYAHMGALLGWPTVRRGAFGLPFTTPASLCLFLVSAIVAGYLAADVWHDISESHTVVLFSDDVYDKAEFVVDALVRSNISYYLGYGTALGAARYGGILQHDYDMDIYTVNASEHAVETVLEFCKESGALENWLHQTDGAGPGDTGFGYHLSFPGTEFYADIWLMTEADSVITCTGRGGGCARWFRKHEEGRVWHDFQIKHDDIFPTRVLPFGTKFFRFPNKTKKYLDDRFPNWTNLCGGQWGNRKCRKEEVAFYRAQYESNLAALGA